MFSRRGKNNDDSNPKDRHDKNAGRRSREKKDLDIFAKAQSASLDHAEYDTRFSYQGKATRSPFTAATVERTEPAGDRTKTGVEFEKAESVESPEIKSKTRDWIKFGISIVLTSCVLILSFIDFPLNRKDPLLFLLSLPVLYFSGSAAYADALRSLRRLKLNANLLVLIGTGAAMLYSVLSTVVPHIWTHSGLSADVYYDVATVILVFTHLGSLLEARAQQRSSRALLLLRSLQADHARVVVNGSEKQIIIDDVRAGDTVKVLSSEKIPVDGTLLFGSALIDESSLTGEAMPVEKMAGDRLYAGSINRNGSFTMQARAVGEQTALSKILKQVRKVREEETSHSKGLDGLARWFIPAIIVLACASFAFWSVGKSPPEWSKGFSAFLAVLFIACPCVLGLVTSIPILFASKRSVEWGIIIRNTQALFAARKLDVLLVDKTGTLTEGTPKLIDIMAFNGFDQNRVLQYAAIAYESCDNPVSRAIVTSARSQGITIGEADFFCTLDGNGVEASWNGLDILIGSPALMEERRIPHSFIQLQVQALIHSGKLPILVAIDGNLKGLISIADCPRVEAREWIQEIREMGIEVIMVTGDSPNVARSIAQTLRIEKALASHLPYDKMRRIKSMQKQGLTVGMVGDGLNDAPALAQADAGFALADGDEEAMEASDFTVVQKGLTGVITAIRLSQNVVQRIKANLFYAFIFNLICLPAAIGLFSPLTGTLMTPIIARAAMIMSIFLVLAGSMHVRFFKFRSSM